MFWIAEEILGCFFFYNITLIKEDNPVRYITGEPHLMGNG
jgi:hypothetical protein